MIVLGSLALIANLVVTCVHVLPGEFVPVLSGFAAVVLIAGAARRDRSPQPGDRDGAADLRWGLVWICVAALVLLVVEIGHPGDWDDTYDFLSQSQHLYAGPDWWIALHVIQGVMLTVLVAGMVMAASRFPPGLRGVSRTLTVIFGALYIMFDSVVGIATGVLISRSLDRPPSERKQAATAVNDIFGDKIFGSSGTLLSLSASVALLLALGAVAVGLAMLGCSWLTIAAMGASAALLEWSHTRWFGPLGWAFLLIALVPLMLASRARESG